MKKELEELNKKVDVLIALSILDKNIKTNEKVILLGRLGLDNKDTSKILGISESHVRKEKSLRKRKNA